MGVKEIAQFVETNEYTTRYRIDLNLATGDGQTEMGVDMILLTIVIEMWIFIEVDKLVNIFIIGVVDMMMLCFKSIDIYGSRMDDFICARKMRRIIKE